VLTLNVHSILGPQHLRNVEDFHRLIEFAPQRTRSEPIELGTLALEEASVNLMFKLVGKNEQSSGFGFDLIAIHCEKVE